VYFAAHINKIYHIIIVPSIISSGGQSILSYPTTPVQPQAESSTKNRIMTNNELKRFRIFPDTIHSEVKGQSAQSSNKAR